MPSESFYGITLKGKNTNEVWYPALDDEDLLFETLQKLIIKQAMVGSDAVEGEMNVVEVQSITGTSGTDIIKIPIAILKLGSINQIGLDLTFPEPPVTFTLVEGSGPVHICGLQIMKNQYEDTDFLGAEMTTDSETDSDDNTHVVTNGRGKYVVKKY